MNQPTLNCPAGSSPADSGLPTSATPSTGDPDGLLDSNIMVVDDDASTTESIANNLLTMGFRNIHAFNDPAEAVRSIKTISPDIILLDIRMPGISGIEILKFLRTRPRTRYVPVIVLSAAIDEPTRLRALDAGANDFVNKSVGSKELIARIRNALEFRQRMNSIETHAETVERELLIDTTTQLWNRRAFDEQLDLWFANRVNFPFSLILFDLDKFKIINDYYGHRIGDMVLKHAANVTSGCSTDFSAFAARIGGDEFAVLCPGDADTGLKLARLISRQIFEQPVSEDRHSITVRISAGVSLCDLLCESKAVLFDDADTALYQSKDKRGAPVLASAARATGTGTASPRAGEAEEEWNAEFRLRSPESGQILIVDDEPAITETLGSCLKAAGFQHVHLENNATLVMDRIRTEMPDLVLLDIRMPGINGLELLKNIRESEHVASTPVIIMTATHDERVRMAALKLRANDYIGKPANAAELVTRSKNCLLVKFQHDQLTEMTSRLRHEVAIRTDELLATRREAILCLARAAESRDTETGNHVIRVGRLAGIIGKYAGLDERQCNWIELAAQLHDVGKLSIPDSILYKPAKLTEGEYEIMKTHCAEANRILGRLNPQGQPECTSPLLQMAVRIASSHHEWWDGSGYPNQLSGEDIPIEGRITAVADVFDAMFSKRQYKEAFSLQKCFDLLEQGRGTHFDPAVLDAFFRGQQEIIALLHELA
jgi:putative two-component system response regulator